jgi:hypothetical protein
VSVTLSEWQNKYASERSMTTRGGGGSSAGAPGRWWPGGGPGGAAVGTGHAGGEDTLDDTDHADHKEQGSMIRRCII